jgi:hypothetical protein
MRLSLRRWREATREGSSESGRGDGEGEVRDLSLPPLNRRHWGAFKHRLFQAGAAPARLSPGGYTYSIVLI